MTLSMCMIARDSARTIRAALESIRPWVDEMVVVDTGSRDDTAAIAIACGARVAHFAWCDDFSAARNESLGHARGTWILWMDSDDTIDAANGAALRALADRTHQPSTMGFVIQVLCPPLEGEAHYDTPVAVDHVKLLRNHPAIRFTGRIHEQVLPAIRRLGGEIGWSDVRITHSGADRSIAGQRRKHERDLRLLELELADRPDDSFALFNAGMTLLAMGAPERALPQLCRSLQLVAPGESHFAKIYALLVQTYAALGRRETALKTCLQGLRTFPDDPELLFRRGSLAQSFGRLDEAEQAFLAVLAAPPARRFASVDQGVFGIKAWHNLAVLYQRGGRNDRAANAWRRVIALDATSSVAWWGLLSVASGVAAAELAATCAALPDDDRYRELRTAWRAYLALTRGQPEEAVRLIAPALAARDASIDLWEAACRIAFQGAVWETAETWLATLTERVPKDASPTLNLAAVYVKRGKYAEAIAAARRAIALRPGYGPAERLLSMAQQAAKSSEAQR
jgi:tetratricopeptide (TPR) repeat protein